jgi:pimeloyl-ACP methyl ester carboxylesterase
MTVGRRTCKRASRAGALSLVAVLCACATVRTTGYHSLSGKPITYAAGGNGSPAVVFESGLGDGKEVWGRVMPAIARTNQVFAYDRPGYGGSRSVAGTRDPCTVAAEEHDLLRSVGIAPPYILVGHSVGGLYEYVYAKLYPQEVAGVVLVDPTHPQWRQALQREAPLLAALGHALTRVDNTQKREWDNMDDCLSGIDTTTPLHIPARVLVGTRYLSPLHLAIKDLANRSSADWSRLAGTQVEPVPGSGHYIEKDRPQAVIGAIAEVSAAARASSGKP